MFESAEQKAEILNLIDRARAAVEQEDPHAIEALTLEVFALMLRVVAKDIPGALPMVIMEKSL